jgi:UDP-N-acetylglucosamine 3-dehydrogenase
MSPPTAGPAPSAGRPAPMRAGVVGLGMMGRNHVRVYDEVLADVELVAVADPDAAAVRRATTGRAARGHADPATMFAEERLDLVSIVAPTSLHRQVTLDALASGANVLVEKPIASDREQAEAMIEAARRTGRLLTVGHIERFNPAIRELRHRLAAGELGRIFQIKATRLGPFPARIRDVGVVLDLAPHDIDVMRFLLDSEPVRLYAETEQRIHTDHEDLFNGILKFANGVIGVLDINWLTPTKRRTLTVTGERGMYVADYINQDLVYYANPDATQIWEHPGPGNGGRMTTSVSEGEMARRSIHRQEPLAVELAEFARAVRSGGPPPVEPRDAMIALLLAQKMVEAAQRGTVMSGDELAEVLA